MTFDRNDFEIEMHKLDEHKNDGYGFSISGPLDNTLFQKLNIDEEDLYYATDGIFGVVFNTYAFDDSRQYLYLDLFRHGDKIACIRIDDGCRVNEGGKLLGGSS